MDVQKLLNTELAVFNKKGSTPFLNGRVYYFLHYNGIKTVNDLVENPYSLYENWKLTKRNFGDTSLKALKNFVDDLNLYFDYPNPTSMGNLGQEKKYLIGEGVKRKIVSLIKSRRLKLDYSDDMLFQKLNIKPSSVYKIENFKFNASADLLLEILYKLDARILIITVEDLGLVNNLRYALLIPGNQDYWTCLDLVSQLICTFKEGKFNETKEFSLPDIYQKQYLEKGIQLVDFLSENTNLMTNWLIKNHNNIL